MEEKSKEIEKPWCVYGQYLGLWNFGKIEREYDSTVDVRYSEGQRYPPQCWDSEWVKRFGTLKEAVEHYIKNRPRVDIRDRDSTDDKIRKQAEQKFPSYFKEKNNHFQLTSTSSVLCLGLMSILFKLL